MKATDETVRQQLNDLSEYLTWRGMSVLYGNINHATLNGYAAGRPIVNSRHRQIFGLDALIKSPPCPTCGEACTFDCGTQSVKNKEDPRQLTRCTVYPTTAVDKIISDLYRVTGKTFCIMEDELEY